MNATQTETLAELIERLRSLSIDHGPKGWPAVRTRDITALLDRIAELEAQLEAIGAGGVSGPLMGASLAASAGSEPVAEMVPFHTPSGKRVAVISRFQHLPIGTKLYTHPYPPEGMEGWISVDERLPEPNVEVLCAGRGWGNSFVTACYYDDERREWYPINTHWTDATGCAQYPTHWMPLPASPTIEGESK